ncbi:MAG: DUF1653 domain-containing protein [bacterium]
MAKEEIKLSEEAKSLKLGLYKHYKNNNYQVLGVAIHNESLEELVIYKALYGEGLTWVRPLKMFLETVNVDGVTKPRFTFIKPL